MRETEPIFIIGVGRSGTSLLQSMLNSHSEITFPPETHFIRFYLSDKQDFNNIKSKLLDDQNLVKLGIPLIEVIKNSIDVKDVYVQLLEQYRLQRNTKFIGDKDPKNIEFLKTVKALFPNSYIIHIYRDPRSVIASRLKADWSKNKPFWQQILAYKAHLSYARKKGSFLFDRYIEIKYENLLLNPNTELIKVTNKLGLQYEVGMLVFYKNSKEIVRDNEKKWKKNIFKPIMKENIEKWKSNLSENQIRIIEDILSNEMKVLGYNKSVKLSVLFKLKNLPLKISVIIMSSLYKLRLN